LIDNTAVWHVKLVFTIELRYYMRSSCAACKISCLLLRLVICDFVV